MAKKTYLVTLEVTVNEDNLDPPEYWPWSTLVGEDIMVVDCIQNRPCSVCGDARTELHPNGICGNCFVPPLSREKLG